MAAVDLDYCWYFIGMSVQPPLSEDTRATTVSRYGNNKVKFGVVTILINGSAAYCDFVSGK